VSTGKFSAAFPVFSPGFAPSFTSMKLQERAMFEFYDWQDYLNR
jgi:hypothetical protein